MSINTNYYSQALSERSANHGLRKLRHTKIAKPGFIEIDGKLLRNFGSNDYLGLSQHHLLKERAVQYIQEYGTSVSSSRLVCGNIDAFGSIEKKLAELKNYPAALIFPSGFQTNSTALSCLTEASSTVFADRLVHNSIIQGLLAKKSARFQRFKHNDIQDLRNKLENKERDSSSSNSWIVTESVFSMDGDICDLNKIAEIAKTFSCQIFLDEAHACGVFGIQGMGLATYLILENRLSHEELVVMGTFSKAFGASGAYILCTEEIKDYLINFCPGIIYSTGLSPASLGAIDASLDLIPNMTYQRKTLVENAEYLRNSLAKIGFEITNSESQIIPIIIGSPQEALSLAQYLEKNGLFVPCIRPPTVEEGKSRLRVSLTTNHERDHINELLFLLEKWREKNH